MKKHKHLIIILVLLVLFVIGYAFLQTSLSINGSTALNRHSWSIHFDQESLVPYASQGVSVSQYPTFTDDTTITYGLELHKPGDYAELTFDVVNDGTLDAMIDNIYLTVNGEKWDKPDYLQCYVTYSDGIKLEEHHLLSSLDTESYKLRVEYSRDINESQLVHTDYDKPLSLSLSFHVSYTQADDKAYERDRYVYTYSDNLYDIGDRIPKNVCYSSRDKAIAASSHPLYIKHFLQNGVIISSWLGFAVEGNENTLYFELPVGSNQFQPNQSFMNSVFGIDEHGNPRCGFPANSNQFTCEFVKNNAIEWSFSMDSSAHMILTNEGYTCGITSSGSACGTLNDLLDRYPDFSLDS